MLTFGDTFKHREKDLVYLAQTADILYAALILPSEDSRLLNSLEKRIKDSARAGTMLSNKLYCFVQLTTEEFKDRIAHLGSPQQDESTITEYVVLTPTGKLNSFDLKQIKKEIEQGLVPEELKELTKDITL